MKAGVIGHPITHSKSPIIHQYWLDEYHISGSYEAIDIAPDNLAAEIQRLMAEGYSGFNVTVPHKQAVMALCDGLDETAQKIGAVNVVVIRNKKLFGQNTDAFGFIQNIMTSQPDFSCDGKTAFILGAGGAARAVIYGLLQAGISRIKIANRTIEKAEELKEFAPDKIDIIDWEDRSKALMDVDLLVNTTSLGMMGKPILEIDLSALPTGALVNDIVYAPLMTDLLVAAEKRGNKIVTGIGMLLHQARPAFAAWTGTMPEVTKELEAQVLT